MRHAVPTQGQQGLVPQGSVPTVHQHQHGHAHGHVPIPSGHVMPSSQPMGTVPPRQSLSAMGQAHISAQQPQTLSNLQMRQAVLPQTAHAMGRGGISLSAQNTPQRSMATIQGQVTNPMVATQQRQQGMLGQTALAPGTAQFHPRVQSALPPQMERKFMMESRLGGAESNMGMLNNSVNILPNNNPTQQ